MTERQSMVIPPRPTEVKMLPRSTQQLLNAFVFFLAFPSISIFGNSITFYIFIILLIRSGIFWTKNIPYKNLLFTFLMIVCAATALGPYAKMDRYPGFFYSLQILIQYLYWILMAVYFMVYKGRYQMMQLSQWIFYGVCAATIGYYLLPFNVGSFGIELMTKGTRNSYVFTLLCTIPLAFKYIVAKWGLKKSIWFFPAFLLVMLLTNGRSGAIIILLELMLIAAILYRQFNRTIKFMLIPFVLLFLLMESSGLQPYLEVLASQVESINPRFASLLRSEGEGDLTFDKSWLIRKLMIDKGFEIVKEYPVLGVGANNFKYYDGELESLSKYSRLGSQTMEFYNSRSAHNSYIQVLTEFGVLGFFNFILLLIIPLIYQIRLIILDRNHLDYLPLIALLGITMHFYAISSFTGAVPWFLIGISLSLIDWRKVRR
ncbi:MAG: O-antigen ligase family protein [Chitinophagaceae bacterium]|nr:O-antigen ligase family protein [Chitinophagaceae bacterium]